MTTGDNKISYLLISKEWKIIAEEYRIRRLLVALKDHNFPKFVRG